MPESGSSNSRAPGPISPVTLPLAEPPSPARVTMPVNGPATGRSNSSHGRASSMGQPAASMASDQGGPSSNGIWPPRRAAAPSRSSSSSIRSSALPESSTTPTARSAARPRATASARASRSSVRTWPGASSSVPEISPLPRVGSQSAVPPSSAGRVGIARESGPRSVLSTRYSMVPRSPGSR